MSEMDWIPVDDRRLETVAMSEPEVILKGDRDTPRESWSPKLNYDGKELGKVQVAAVGSKGGGVIGVEVPRDAAPVHAGDRVRVEDLERVAWSFTDKSGTYREGVRWQAAAIRPLNARPTEKQAAA